MKSEPSNAKSRQKKLNVLVIGDWFVDEHWLSGIHRSSTSSRVGEEHYRALTGIESSVTTFCGAGMPASLLHQIFNDEGSSHNVNIVGLGYWHEGDEDILTAMFDLNSNVLSCFRLSHVAKKSKDRSIQLINLSRALLDQESKNHIATTRIIRMYHSSASLTPTLKYRLDWEQDLSQLDLTLDENKLPDVLHDIKRKGKIDAVVVKDMNKGVVSEQLIEALSKDADIQDAEWFVSSKAWDPEWFSKLKNVNLRMLLIPQVPAQSAIKKEKLSSWITHNGYPDNSAYTMIDHLHGIVNNASRVDKNTLYIVLPEGYSVIACNYKRHREEHNPEYLKKSKYTVVEKISPDEHDTAVQYVCQPLVDMPLTGMASMFFPFIMSKLLRMNHDYLKDLKGEKLRELIEDTLLDTLSWAKNETNKIINGKYLYTIMGDHKKNKVELKKEANFRFRSPLSTRVERLKWAIASVSIGAIGHRANENTSSFLTLDLWRSTIEVSGYVCLDDTRRKQIRRLIDALRRFKNEKRKYHVGCLVVAEPGSGKTFLARKLAKTMGLRLLPFNITQMLETKDILNCFDEIETAQSQYRELPILVFIDEINASIAKDTVYGAFLSPIEEGVYIRGGKEFHIAPCFWLFSGTQHLMASNDDKPRDHDGANKKSDFLSRLSMGEIDLTRKSTSRTLQVENVYMGVSLLRNEFPDVRYISKGVLKIFYYLAPQTGIRDMKHFVKLFSDIQYNKVTIKNVPEENKIPAQLMKFVYDSKGKIKSILESTDDSENNEMVEIVD